MIPKPDKQLKKKKKEVKFGGSHVSSWEEGGKGVGCSDVPFLDFMVACCAVIIHSAVHTYFLYFWALDFSL